jgi:L-asparagine transporter-like permease
VITLTWLVLRNDFVSLITTAVFINMAFYILQTHTLFTLRRQRVGEENCYRVPLYPWLPLVFLVVLYGMFIGRLVLDWERAWVDLALLGLGIPASILWMRYRKP